MQFNIKTKKNSIKKWVEDLNRHLSKKDMAKKHLERCSTSITIIEMHIHTTKRYHSTLFRMILIKKSTNNKYWRQSVEKRELSHSIGGNVIWLSTMENSMEVP